jgi:hypothetical protein
VLYIIYLFIVIGENFIIQLISFIIILLRYRMFIIDSYG